MKRKIATGKLKQSLLVLVLLCLEAAMLLPFFWVFATSLRLPKDSFSLPPSFFPTQWNWENYSHVFTSVPFFEFIKNSVVVTVSITGIQLVFSSMCAFAFARLKFKGGNLLFIYILTGLMIPYQSIIIAQFLIVTKMGLVDTHLALILPYLANPFGIFLLKQFMQTIPKSYDEAAIMDGANWWQIYWHVILPMSKPALVVCAFMKFIEQWNNFFAGLIYINSQEKYTLPMGMMLLRGFRSSGSVSMIMAGVMISLIVPALVYIFGQKYLIQGTVLSGLKS